MYLCNKGKCMQLNEDKPNALYYSFEDSAIYCLPNVIENPTERPMQNVFVDKCKSQYFDSRMPGAKHHVATKFNDITSQRQKNTT